MKNDLFGNETEWRGTDMVNVSVDVKGKGEIFLYNEETKVKHQQNQSSYLLYAFFSNVLNYRMKCFSVNFWKIFRRLLPDVLVMGSNIKKSESFI